MHTLLKRLAKKPLHWLASQYFHYSLTPQSPQLRVLMYHRILPKQDSRYSTEEPGMIVEADTFKQHLKLIKQHLTPIHLSEWIDRQQKGLSLPKNACAITFDDGWADNYEYAYPVIKDQQVPVTLFVVSDMIGTDRQFWPNQVNQLLMNNPINDLKTLDWLRPHLSSTGNLREASSYTIKQLKQFSDEQIYRWLTHLPNQIKPETNTSSANQGLMNWEQLITMSKNDLVEVGSHTCNHYRLNSTLDKQALSNEVINSKRLLQDKLSQDINLFCYPNGDTCKQAIDLVQAHYKAAVTTQQGINKANILQPYTLNRIGIHQDQSDSDMLFKARLANWF